MEPIEQLSYIVPTLNSIVDRIQAMQMNDPTPCANFTVHGVMNHMMVGGTTFAHMFRGEQAPDPKPHGVYGWVPVAEFREVMDDLLDAVKSPGAMERTINAPIGAMPGSAFARFVAFDGLIHGWDLATAIGVRYEMRADVVSSVDAFAREALTPALRDGDTFKDATPAPLGAGTLESLVAFSGRAL